MTGFRASTLAVAAAAALGACGPSARVAPGEDGGGTDGVDARSPADRTDARPAGDQCEVSIGEDGDGVPVCDDVAPPDSFEPEIQWTWTGASEPSSIVTPLVANMTDDNADGKVNLCDVPDVVVVASIYHGSPSAPGHIYVLDGQTGAQETMFAQAVDSTVTPALGDIDGDGSIDVVTAEVGGNLIAFERTGEVKWSKSIGWSDPYSGAIALADLDGDGTVEIVAGNIVADHLGNLLWAAPQPAGSWSATAVADLDNDGSQEVVLGHAAYHANGTEYYMNAAIAPGYPQIANLDDDPQPEILVTNVNGISVLEHDGTTKFADLRPTGDVIGFTTWLRPATIHDFDGDGAPEFAVSSANHYTVYETNGSILWSAPVSDQSGIAAGTAFDFLGDGTAEAMYADEQSMFVFGNTGQVLLQIPRTSETLSEYPVVADVDNDGSAEIVVTSNLYITASPTVQVIRDKQDRWIQARRIWNQHTYHVTNVREDGSIPQHEVPSWNRLNTFRTNAQIGEDGVCAPEID